MRLSYARAQIVEGSASRKSVHSFVMRFAHFRSEGFTLFAAKWCSVAEGASGVDANRGNDSDSESEPSAAAAAAAAGSSTASGSVGCAAGVGAAGVGAS
eukprot:29346-Pelagococcus_subviridis.AAC.5